MRRMTTRLLLLALLWSLTTGGVFSGCRGLFSPATPQAPTSTGGTTIALNYTSPEDALATLAAGIAAKGHGNGQEAYIKTFADVAVDGVAFSATFDPEVARRHEQSGREVPVWDLALERNFYRFFVELRSESYLLRWTTNEVRGNDIIGAEEATLYRKYQVFLVGENGSA